MYIGETLFTEFVSFVGSSEGTCGTATVPNTSSVLAQVFYSHEENMF